MLWQQKINTGRAGAKSDRWVQTFQGLQHDISAPRVAGLGACLPMILLTRQSIDPALDVSDLAKISVDKRHVRPLISIRE
jgi:hypothetical protein